MHRLRLTAATLVSVALALTLVACGDDDGGDVRNIGEDCPSGSASGSASATGSGSASGSATGSGSGSGSASASCPPGSGSGSGSGSASGIASEVEGSQSDDPLVQQAVQEYAGYVREQVDETIAATKTFTDAIRNGDLEAAKAAYAPSRQGWERIEPIAGLVEEIDGAVDARVDDFEGVDDPEFTGWHRIEHILWVGGTTEPAVPFADQLDADLQTLRAALDDLEIPPAALAVGSAELIEEVSTGKITGEEDRYSHTDLWDFAANVEGSQAAFDLLAPAVEQQDADLVAEIGDLFGELEDQLAAYAEGDGYRPYTDLTGDDKTEMQATLAELSEKLSTVAGVLGLA